MTSRLSALVTESERDRLDLQMLFGVHVYSRAKVVPDLALSRGEDAYRAARLHGDRAIEFLSAGGVAMTLLDLGDVEGAERWLDLAAAAASMALSRGRSIQLEPGTALPGRTPRIRGHARPSEKAVAMATAGGRLRAGARHLPTLPSRRPGSSHGRPRAARLTRNSSISSSDRRRRSRRCCRFARSRAMGRARRCRARDGRLARGSSGAATAGGAHSGPPGHHEDASREIIVPAARGSRRRAAGGPGSVRDFLRRPSAHRPGHGRRIDPRPLADGAHRPLACRAGWPVGRQPPPRPAWA